MSRTDSTDQRATDGGTVSSPFEVRSDVEETRSERYEKLFDTYVRTPGEIIWSDWRARIGFLIVGVYVLVGVISVLSRSSFFPTIIAETFVIDGGAYVQPFETSEFPLGTDSQGRDILARMVHSTPTILIMMASGGVATITVGTLVGAVAGYRGGWIDTVLSSITDVFINIPGYPLVMVLALLLPISGNPIIIGLLLSVTAWGGLSRKMRSQVLTLREESFVEASRATGQPSHKIVLKDILPHLMPYAMINLASTSRKVIFEAAGLYFLGILPYGDPNWGVMLNRAYESGAFYRPEAFHWFAFPALAIILIGTGLILLSQSLDRVFNPRVRARHEDRTGDSDTIEGEL
jgi:peptide/nickel transport system permease protein